MLMQNPELQTRLKTALILVAGMLSLLTLSWLFVVARWIIAVLFLSSTVLIAWEVSSLSCLEQQPENIKSDRFSIKRLMLLTVFILPSISVFMMGLMLPAAPSSAVSAQVTTIGSPAALLFGVGLSFILSLLILSFFVGKELANAERELVVLYIGLVLVGVGAASLLALSLSTKAAALLLWLMLTVFLNDTAAYFAGRYLKGMKLAPHLSPNKTVSGALAGLLVGVGVGVLSSSMVISSVSFALKSDILVLALLVVIAAQMGDLAKSLLKRVKGVKDMSAILPGHGGLLDRVDGLLAGAMVLYPWILLYS